MATITFGILHAREMLDRTRYPDRDIQIGGDDFPGLPDLKIVGRVAGTDSTVTRADRRTKPVVTGVRGFFRSARHSPARARRQRRSALYRVPVFRSVPRRPFRARGFQTTPYPAVAIVSVTASPPRKPAECRGTNRQYLDRLTALDRRQCVARINRTAGGISRHHGTHVGNGCNIEQSSNARHQIFAKVRCRRQEVGIRHGICCDQRRKILRRLRSYCPASANRT